jgi:20S proteasome alpha/beta subunit
MASETKAGTTGSDVVITASDRMITLGGSTEYIWGEQTKTFWFSNLIVMLTAGDPNLALEICRNAKRTLDGRPLTVERVAKKVAQKFREYRMRRNEWRILSPHGLTFETLIKNEQNLAPTVVSKIINQLYGDEGVLNSTMIIAGLDDNAGHIYLIDDPGDCICCDSEGFAAIGAGKEHAESVLAESMYTDRVPWTEAVVVVYLAKKRAEVAPGVGTDTDLYWIKPEGYGYVEPTDDLMLNLEKVRNIRDQRMRRAVEAGHQRLRNLIQGFSLRSDH